MISGIAVVSSNCVGAGLSNPLCQGVGGVGSAIFGTGASAALDALSTWVGTGSAWLLQQIGTGLNSSTTVDLGSPWFLQRYHAAEVLVGTIALPLFLAATVQAIIRQDFGLLLRAAFVQLPLAMVLAGAAIELTSLAIGLTDELAIALSSTDPHAVQDLMTQLASAVVNAGASTGSAAPAFVALLAALIVALAGLVLWIELVVRTAAIYVAVAFFPLVVVSMVWPALTRWSRRLAETLLALIASKLVVVVVLNMAVGALGTRQDRSFATVVTGIGLLVMAALAPFSLLRLLPMFESSAALHLEGLRHRAVSSVMNGTPRKALDMALARGQWTPPLPALLQEGASPSQQQPGETVGESSQVSPLDQRPPPSQGLVPSPFVRSTEQGVTSSQPVSESTQPSRVQWSNGIESPKQTPSRRTPSLVIEQDAIGPLIKMVPNHPSVRDAR